MKLPARPSDKVLDNSVVEIAVNGAGEVVAQHIVSPGSGSKEADREALKQAKLLRFRPLNAIGTIWGQATFEWETTEPGKK
jgi:TonB family protein